MKTTGKRLRKFLYDLSVAIVKDRVLVLVLSANALTTIAVFLSGEMTRLSTDISHIPLTKWQTPTVIWSSSFFALFCVLLVAMSNFIIKYRRSRKDVLFLRDDDIKLAYYLNSGALDPFPFCKRDEIRMNPPDMSRSIYKCGECGREVTINIFSPEWEYRKNTAIAKAEKILRSR